MSDTDVSEFQMSSDDRLDSVDEARSNSDHRVVKLGAIAMKQYQDQPGDKLGLCYINLYYVDIIWVIRT